MSCGKYRFCAEVGGKQLCICVSLLMDREWWKKPDPRERLFIDIDGLKREDVRQMQVLATIAELATELPAQLRRDIQKNVSTQMEAFSAKLGGNFSISEFEDDRATAV
jgi:hypothetical protein